MCVCYHLEIFIHCKRICLNFHSLATKKRLFTSNYFPKFPKKKIIMRIKILASRYFIHTQINVLSFTSYQTLANLFRIKTYSFQSSSFIQISKCSLMTQKNKFKTYSNDGINRIRIHVTCLQLFQIILFHQNEFCFSTIIPK